MSPLIDAVSALTTGVIAVTLIAVIAFLPVLMWDVLTLTPTEIGESDE